MKTILQTEELAQLAIAIIGLLLQPLHFSWWLWVILFLSPDISMLGYLISTKTGAVCYNLFHHKLIAIVILIGGYFLRNDAAVFIGLLLYAHSSFDRMMGYGLKYPDSFRHTHLGAIGKNRAD